MPDRRMWDYFAADNGERKGEARKLTDNQEKTALLKLSLLKILFENEKAAPTDIHKWPPTLDPAKVLEKAKVYWAWVASF